MKGICLIEPLFEKTVEGIKTQTRSILNITDCSESHKNYEGAEWKDNPMEIHFNGAGAYCGLCGNGVSPSNGYNGIKPKYKIGEVLYLKESYRFVTDYDKPIYKFDYPTGRYEYRGCDKDITPVKWINKMLMPTSAARYFIKITGIRVERLQDISDEDCIKEGVFIHYNGFDFKKKDPYYMNGDGYRYSTPCEAYSALIDKINGKGTWDSNPYGWVYDFIKCDRYGTVKQNMETKEPYDERLFKVVKDLEGWLAEHSQPDHQK